MSAAVSVNAKVMPSAASRRMVAPRAVRMAAKARARAVDVPANDLDEPAAAPAARSTPAKSSKTDGSGYLTMYFRDMASLHVLRPEEEFTAAREIEALELLVWRELLSSAPMV